MTFGWKLCRAVRKGGLAHTTLQTELTQRAKSENVPPFLPGWGR